MEVRGQILVSGVHFDVNNSKVNNIKFFQRHGRLVNYIDKYGFKFGWKF